MLSRKNAIPFGVGIMMMAAVFLLSLVAHGMGAKSEDGPIPYQRMSMNDYQNFIRDWDEKKTPLLYALISTPDQYNALFNPAATMHSLRAFSPEASLYAREQILVVARVMPFPGNVDAVFAVDRLTARNQELVLHYRFNKQESDAKWHGKIYMAIRIPKNNYQKVLFFENGKQVGALNIAAGQWSVINPIDALRSKLRRIFDPLLEQRILLMPAYPMASHGELGSRADSCFSRIGR